MIASLSRSSVIIEDIGYSHCKVASKSSGFDRGYITQLCRIGAVLCKKVGPVWYVNEASLRAYGVEQEQQKALRRGILSQDRREEFKFKQTDATLRSSQEARTKSVMDLLLRAMTQVSAGSERAHPMEIAIFGNGRRMFSTREASHSSGLSMSYISMLCTTGVLTCVLFSGTWLVDEASLKEFLLERESKNLERQEKLSHESKSARAIEKRKMRRSSLNVPHPQAPA
jgi:hypothetical protein